MVRSRSFIVLVLVLGIGAASIRAPSRAAAQMPGPGSVLIEDTFDDPGRGVLPQVSSNPARFRVGYDGGEYVIAKVAPDAMGWFEWPNRTFADATIAVDARLVGETDRRWVAVSCRYSPTGRYVLTIYPAMGLFFLDRFDGMQQVNLARETSSSIRRGNESNRLALSCSGTTIMASLNGERVASVEDGTHQMGLVAIGTGYSGPGSVEARFDSLRVTQPGAPAPVAMVLPLGQPLTVAALAMAPAFFVTLDDFTDSNRGALPSGGTEPSQVEVGYVDGEYFVVNRLRNSLGIATQRSAYTDTSLTIDARLLGDPAGKAFFLACRVERTEMGLYGYVLIVGPSTGLVRLARIEGPNATPLAEARVPAVVRGGNEPNQATLTCAGDSLSASVNGTGIAEASDSTYGRGQIGIGVSSGPNDEAEARFDNFALTSALPTAVAMTPPMPPESMADAPPPAPMPPSMAATPAMPASPVMVGDAPPGTVLLSETLQAPSSLGPPVLNQPQVGLLTGYDEGEYFIRLAARPQSSGFSYALPPSAAGDLTVAVDARMVEDQVVDRGIALYCRQETAMMMGPRDGYRFLVEPSSGQYSLSRSDPGPHRSTMALLGSGQSAAVRRGSAWNRFELTCAGSQITGTINGVVVVTVQDSTYLDGRAAIGLLTQRNNMTAEARFKNLTVTQR